MMRGIGRRTPSIRSWMVSQVMPVTLIAVDLINQSQLQEKRQTMMNPQIIRQMSSLPADQSSHDSHRSYPSTLPTSLRYMTTSVTGTSSNVYDDASLAEFEDGAEGMEESEYGDANGSRGTRVLFQSEEYNELFDTESDLDPVLPFKLTFLPGTADGRVPPTVKPLSTLSFGGHVRIGTQPYVFQQAAHIYTAKGGRTFDVTQGYEMEVFEKLVHHSLHNELDPETVFTILPLSYVEAKTGHDVSSRPKGDAVDMTRGFQALTARNAAALAKELEDERGNDPNTTSLDQPSHREQEGYTPRESTIPSRLTTPEGGSGPLKAYATMEMNPMTLSQAELGGQVPIKGWSAEQIAKLRAAQQLQLSRQPKEDSATDRIVHNAIKQLHKDDSAFATEADSQKGAGPRRTEYSIRVGQGSNLFERMLDKISHVVQHMEGDCVDLVILRDFHDIIHFPPEKRREELTKILMGLEIAVARGYCRGYGFHSPFFQKIEDYLELPSTPSPPKTRFDAALATSTIDYEPIPLSTLYECSVEARNRVQQIRAMKAAASSGTEPVFPPAVTTSNLKAVAFRANLFENGLLREKTCRHPATNELITPLEYAKARGLLTFADSVFDARVAANVEVRLESFEAESYTSDYLKNLERTVQDSFKRAMQLEAMYADMAVKTGVNDLPPPMEISWAHIVSASLDGIYNPIRWEQVTQGMLWPMVLKAHDRIRQVDSLRQWTLEHREAIQSLAMAMEQFIQRSVAPINHDIFTFLEEQYPPLRKLPRLEDRVLAVMLGIGFDSVQTTLPGPITDIAGALREALTLGGDISEAKRKGKVVSLKRLHVVGDVERPEHRPTDVIPSPEKARAIIEAFRQDLAKSIAARTYEVMRGVLDINKVSLVKAPTDLTQSPTQSHSQSQPTANDSSHNDVKKSNDSQENR